MADLFDFADGKVTAGDLAQAAMTTAADHADAVSPGWSDKAFDLVREFAHIRHEFLGEDVRTWAHQTHRLELPPKACAWGAVMVRAAKARIIERAGYRTTRIPPQHAKPAVLWRSLVAVRMEAA